MRRHSIVNTRSHADTLKMKSKCIGAEIGFSPKLKPPLIKHVILFSETSDSSDEDLKDVEFATIKRRRRRRLKVPHRPPS